MVIPPAITPEEHARLAAEIRSAETRTSAEIYVVIAHSADDFRLVPFVWGTVAALLLPWVLRFTTALPLQTILLLQVMTFAAVSAVLSLPRLRYRVVPSGLTRDAARRAAMAQFMAHGVHLDGARTAILLYVCMLPPHVEVLADDAIHARLAPDKWRHLVDMIAGHAGSGRLAEGLAAAIRAAGDFLADEFPATTPRRHPRANIVET